MVVNFMVMNYHSRIRKKKTLKNTKDVCSTVFHIISGWYTLQYSVQFMSCLFTLAAMAAVIEGHCWNAQTNDSLDDPPLPSPRPPHVDPPSVPWPLRPNGINPQEVKDMTYVTYTSTSNNNQTINETNENPTKPTNKTNKSKPIQTPTNHKSKNNQTNQTNHPTKKGAISPQNPIPPQVSPPPRVASAQNLVRIYGNGIFSVYPPSRNSHK